VTHMLHILYVRLKTGPIKINRPVRHVRGNKMNKSEKIIIFNEGCDQFVNIKTVPYLIPKVQYKIDQVYKQVL
jgi:hypothetical protein